MKGLIYLDLGWFGEGGGDGGASAGAAADTGSGQGDALEAAIPAAPTRRQKDAYANVVFGKQASSGEQTDASATVGTQEEKPTEKPAEESPEDRQKAYTELVRGKYKDLFTQDTQRIINQRFKETKQTEAQLQKQSAVLDILMAKYNAKDLDGLKESIENDDRMWEDAADEAGMTVKQYKEFTRLQRENREYLAKEQELETQRKADEIMNQWNQEAEALRQKFPQFDLNAECQNPQFTNMLRHGTPVEVAYKAIHLDEIVTEAMKTTAQAAEKRVVDNVRAKGTRPVENGLSSQSTFTVKSDVTKLTKADREEIARRVSRGERISF